jgi:hypothetical protein
VSVTRIHYSRGRNIRDANPSQHQARDFEGFVQALDRDRAPRKDGAGYVCGPFNGTGRRCAKGALPRRWIAVDLDRIQPDILPDLRVWFSQFNGCAWPTHSSTTEAPRERVILELDRDADRTEALAVGRMLAADLAQEFGAAVLVDPSTFKAEQPVFLPPPGHTLARFLGEPINVTRYAKSAPPPSQSPPLVDSVTGEIRGKVQAGGRHAHLVRRAAQFNWRGIPSEAVRVALRAENMRVCDPPKADAEVDAIADDILRRYASQRGRDHAPPPDIPDEQRREQQRKRTQDIGDGTDGQPPLANILGLDEMLRNVVFISDGARVAYRNRPQTALPLNEFRQLTRASETRVGKKHVPTSDLWMQDSQRITTHTLTYRPGHPEFTADPEGSPALNLWRQRPRPASSGNIAPFLEHVAYLVPDHADRERFLSWLAHIEQHPGVLPHTHYLMVTPQTGIGRNWLASLLARVWAGATRLGFDLTGAMQSGFNGALSRRLLVIVDELKAADRGYGAANHSEQLKAMLTTEHRGINPKFGRQHVEFNCARWLMLSQHYDALPLARSDRRVIVISNPTERMPASYYARLYAMLDDDEFVGAVASWLAKRDLTEFNPSEPAPLTEAKAKAIEANISDLERALIELRDSTDSEVMTSADINEYLQDCGLRVPAGRGMSMAYAATGLVPCDRLVMLHGKRRRVVAMRDGERIKSADTGTLMDLLRTRA